MLTKGTKNIWALVLLMLAGVVIGGFIGDYVGSVKYMSWLTYGDEFGLKSPIILDLGVITLQFALTIRFTICGIIGLIVAVFVYKKWIS